MNFYNRPPVRPPMTNATSNITSLALALMALVGCSVHGEDMTTGSADEPRYVHPMCETWVVECLSSEYASKTQTSGCWDCVEQCGLDVWASTMCEAVIRDILDDEPAAVEQCSYAHTMCEWASEDPEADSTSQTYICSACVYACGDDDGQADHCDDLRP